MIALTIMNIITTSLNAVSPPKQWHNYLPGKSPVKQSHYYARVVPGLLLGSVLTPATDTYMYPEPP